MAQILIMAAVTAALQAATHYLFPPKTQNGPRLGDLNVTTSTYGNPINILEGTARLNGNMIWAHPLFEGTDGGGGKGGGSPTTYFYSATFAVAFCKGPVGAVLRIWCDGKLVWDNTQPGQVPSGAGVDFGFNFHGGTETQTPDALIVSLAGVANTPAYRGLCYIVFNDIPLQNYGNRIPNITAEFSQNAVENTTVLPLTPLTEVFNAASNFDGLIYTADWVNGWAYFNLGPNWGSAPLSTMVQNNETTIAELIPPNAGGASTSTSLTTVNMAMGADSNLYMGVNGQPPYPNYFTDFYNSIICFNPQTGVVLGAFPNNFYVGLGGPGLDGEGRPTSVQAARDLYPFNCAVMDSYSNGQYVLIVDVNGDIYVLGSNCTAGVFYLSIADQTTNDTGIYAMTGGGYPICCPGIASSNYCEAWLIRTVPASAGFSIGISKVRVYSVSNTTSYSDVYILTAGEVTGDDGPGTDAVVSITNYGSPLYDSGDDTIVISVQLSNGHFRYIKYSDVDGIVWNSLIQPQTYQSAGNQEFEWLGNLLNSSAQGASSVIQGQNILNFSNGLYNTIVADSGTVVYSNYAPGYGSNGPGGVAGSGSGGDNQQVFDGKTGAILTHPFAGGGLVLLEGGKNSQSPTTLGAIVTDILTRCSFDEDEYDCSMLTQSIDGYVITRVDTGQAMLQQLMNIYLINVIETDWMLKFLPRGQGVIATIIEDDLIRLDDKTAEPYKETRKQDLDLPWRVTLTYMAEALDYQSDTQQATRAITPDPTMFSLNIDDVQISLVLGPSYAKQICEILLYTVWMARHTFQVRMSKKFMWLDAGDSVILQLNNGYQLQLRLSNLDLGTDLTVDSLLEAEDYLTLTSENSAGTPLFTTQSVQSSPPVICFLLDINLLQDTDDNATQTVTYTGIGLPQDLVSWSGAQLEFSATGTGFSPVKNFFTSTPWGYVRTPPPDPVGSSFYTQYKASIIVSMVAGGSQLSATNYAGLCLGLNGFVVLKASGGFEILQFMDLTQLSVSQYQLQGLRRGCQGSDTMVGGISPGDKVIFLNSNWLQVFNQAISQINITSYYEGLPFGTAQSSPTSLAFKSTENNKKPYAPVALGYTSDESGGLTLSWVRRSRVNAGLQDGTGTTPVGEVNESYTLVIYTDSTAATAVRTVTVTNTNPSVDPTFDYTEADIAADFGAMPSTLTFSVAQISAVVGNGYTRFTTLEIA